MEEQQYLNLVKNVIENGQKRQGRNGHVTRSIFGTTMRFNLKDNTLPLLTSKKMFTKGIIEELIWFISGSVDSKILENKKVNIWKGHSSRDFLDSRGLFQMPDGFIGKGYGFQWRSSGGKLNLSTGLGENGIDQLKNVVESLKKDPYSRRHIISSWIPQDLQQMALPPCHCLCQFYVDDNGLSCQLYQRSGDVGLGIPYNITSYALLTHLIAKEVGIDAHEFIHVIGDAHVYEDHVDALKKQLTNELFEFPKVVILKGLFDSKSYDDFEIKNYKHGEVIRMIMAV